MSQEKPAWYNSIKTNPKFLIDTEFEDLPPQPQPKKYEPAPAPARSFEPREEVMTKKIEPRQEQTYGS